jgi:hypothetical protein
LRGVARGKEVEEQERESLLVTGQEAVSSELVAGSERWGWWWMRELANNDACTSWK